MKISRTTVLILALSSLGASENESKWKVVNLQNGKSQVSIREVISKPSQAGFARLTVERGAGPNGKFKVIFTVESPRSMKTFPFNKFEGPSEKGQDECMTFTEIASRPGRTVKCVPNGGFVGSDHAEFQFSSISPRLMPFLKSLHETSKLQITIHSSNSDVIQFECVTQGLKSGIQSLTR